MWSRSMIFFTAIAAVMFIGTPRVVSFAVAGRAGDDRILVADAGLLIRLRDVVDVGAERDDRLARAPRGDPGGRNAGEAARDLEAVLLENAGEVLRRLLFLDSELAEAEHLVDHLLREGRHAVDHVHRLLLQRGKLGVVRGQVDGEGDFGTVVRATAAAAPWASADAGTAMRERSER